MKLLNMLKLSKFSILEVEGRNTNRKGKLATTKTPLHKAPVPTRLIQQTRETSTPLLRLPTSDRSQPAEIELQKNNQTKVFRLNDQGSE